MTKKSSLPETDLARIALLPDDQKRKQLLTVKKGRPPFSYAPVRAEVSAIFNAQHDLMPLEDVTSEAITAGIKKRCLKLPASLEPNLEVALALHSYVRKKSLVAYHHDFMAVPIGRGAKVKLWHDLYFIEDEKPVICYIDPRKSTGLSELARDFVFSVMHHNLARSDFADAQFQIFHFPKGEDGNRIVDEPYRFDKTRLISEETINQSIDTTYNIWFDILDEREKAAQKTPQTGTGGLFGW